MNNIFNSLKRLFFASLLSGIFIFTLFIVSQKKFENTSYWGHLHDYPSFRDSFYLVSNMMMKPEAVVMYGSSGTNAGSVETRHDVFFSDKLNIPMVSIGKGGSDTLTFLGQLLAQESIGKNKALNVFVLSPALFYYGKSTPIASFLKFVTPDMIARIYFDAKESAAKEYLLKYLRLNFSEILQPSLTLYAIQFQNEFFNKIAYIFEYLPMRLRQNYQIFRLVYLKFQSTDVNSAMAKFVDNSDKIKVDWDQEFKKVRENELNSIGDDELYFTAESVKYYRNLNDPKWTFPLDMPPPIENSRNENLNDLKVLAEYVRDNSISSYFIMSPLNPKGYRNIKTLEPTMSMYQEILNNSQQKGYNMWSSEEYAIGDLADHCHLGEIGRWKVNEKIFNYFKTLR